MFDQRDPNHRSLRATVDCAHRNPATLTEREWKDCRLHGRFGEGPSRSFALSPSSPEFAAALERAAQANDAWRDYRSSHRLGDYPGPLSALDKDR